MATVAVHRTRWLLYAMSVHEGNVSNIETNRTTLILGADSRIYAVTHRKPFERLPGKATRWALWRRLRNDQAVAEHLNGKIVLAAVDRTLESPAEPVFDLGELQRILDWARRQIYLIGWESDRSAYQVAWVVDYLLGQLHLVANGATPIATTWNFRET